MTPHAHPAGSLPATPSPRTTLINGIAWSHPERTDAVRHAWPTFHQLHPARTYNAYRMKRKSLLDADPGLAAQLESPVAANAGYISDKAESDFSWRAANRFIESAQELASTARRSQDFATLEVESPGAIAVLALSDTHIGDWATDHDLLERITDEILATDHLYVALLGDLAQMAIKLRGVAEVTSNLLTPELQLEYIDSWLTEIQHKVLFATWDNHAIEREEAGTGISAFKRLLNKRVIYHDGIGHPDLVLGEQTYKLAVSHRFRGSSIENPCHAPMRYLRREGHDREIAMMGDYHVGGMVKFTHGPTTKVAINCGTFQLKSGYARRHFSLFTHPVMPVIRLDKETHNVTPFWSLAEARACGAL